MKTVNNVLQEIEKGKTRGKKGRDLSNDEIRDRCNRIFAFCQKTQEEGGYSNEYSKGQMIAKVTRKLNELATNEALTHNEEMGTIVKSNEHLLSTMQGIMNTLKSNNVQMEETVKQQNTDLVSSRVVQKNCEDLALANLGVLEATEACNSTNKRKFTELQGKYEQAATDRDTWYAVAQASQKGQAASSSSQSLEEMLGEELENTLVTTQEARVAQDEETTKAKQEAEFWQDAFYVQEQKQKEALDAEEKKQKTVEETSVYAESETELWFNVEG